MYHQFFRFQFEDYLLGFQLKQHVAAHKSIPGALPYGDGRDSADLQHVYEAICSSHMFASVVREIFEGICSHHMFAPVVREIFEGNMK